MKTIIARQPILDVENKTMGYELLFRSIENNQNAVFLNGSEATTEVIKNLLVNFGVEKISGGKKIFINFTEELILEKMPTILNKSEVIIEILEDVCDSKEIIECIKDLRSKGYIFAIDGFITGESKEGILEYVDIVKVDFMNLTKNEILTTAKKIKEFDKILLAEKVESKSEFQFAMDSGFTLFQGYYFLEPEILEDSTISSVSSVYLRLIEEINKDEINYAKLANIIKTDTALTYSFLKIVNSVAYYSRRNIESIKDAITRLGIKEGKKIIYFNFLKSMKPEGTPDELIKKSLIRAKQAEKLAKEFGLSEEKEELFLLGLFSLINIILKKDMQLITEKLPIKSEIKYALLGKTNKYANVIDLIIMNEKNYMESLENGLEKNNITIEKFSEIYFESIEWADAIIG